MTREGFTSMSSVGVNVPGEWVATVIRMFFVLSDGNQASCWRSDSLILRVTENGSSPVPAPPNVWNTLLSSSYWPSEGENKYDVCLTISLNINSVNDLNLNTK